MSQTIDNRIVEMQFENKQFESGVQESLSTLDKLKNALKFDDASKNLQDFSRNINKNVDLSGLSKSIDDASSKFSASGIAGMEVIRKLTDFAIEAGKTIASALDAPFKQIREGGWKRAMNIEDAKFQLKGLGIAWETVSEDINYAVADTAFGLDAAAKACSQLSASGVEAGDAMKAALRGISGVAAMGNTEYENIADIFTKAAGNGKVMAMELNRVSQYGLNARASLAKFFNAINEGDKNVENIPEHVKERVKAITKGVKVTEADISEFARKSKIDFESFSYAMDNAFGEHAKKANETFMGSLRNIKAALSKIGAEFATPIIHGAIPIFNQIRIFLNDLRKQMGPVFTVFKNFAEVVSDKVTSKLEAFRHQFLELGAIDHIGNAMKNAFTNILKIVSAVKNAFETVFPPANKFNHAVVDIAKAIDNFSEKLVISDEVLMAFRNVMVVVFNVLKGMITVIKAILPSVGKILSVASKVVTVIAGLVAYLINLVANLNIVKNTMSAIQKAGGLFAYAIEKIKEAFAKLRTILTDTTTVTGRFFLKLKEVATTGAYIVGGALYLAFMKIKDVISYFDTKDPLGSLIEGAKTLINNLKELTVVKKVIDGIEVVFGAVTLAINKTIEAVVKFVKAIKDGKSVFEALGSVALSVVGSISLGFTKLTDKIKSIISDFVNGFTQEKIIEESFETPIANAALGLTGFVQELSLAEGEVKNLDTAVSRGQGTLADYQYQVATTKTTFDKVKTSVKSFGSAVYDSIHEISLSKVLLTAWASILLVIAFNANLLIKKLAGLAGTLSGGLLNIFRTAPTRFDKFKAGVIMISTAIATLAGSIYLLKDVPTDKLQEITKSLAILIGLAGGLSLIATIINQLMVKFSGTGNGFNLFSSNMFMLALGVTAIVGSLKLLDTVNMDKIWTKVAILGAIGVGLTTFSVLMGKFAPQLSLGSVFMLAFAASVLILVKALDNLSHVELDGIVANYKELGVIIVSFAGFAALAGTVGVSSILSMIAFLFGIRTLLNSFDVIKDRLEEYHVGELLVRVCKKIKDEVKAAVEYLKGIFNSLSDFDKGVIVAGIVAFTAGITAMLIGLSKAAKYLKKMAVSATILVASIAAVVFAITKIAQMCNTIPQSSIDKAISMLESVGLLFVAILAISAIFGGDVDLSWDKFGKGKKGKTKLGTKKFKKSGQTEYLKQARKMMADMAILLTSVAIFMNTVGKLTDAEIDRAIPILVGTGIFAVVLMSTVTAISANARSAGKASASIAAFVGMIAVIGTLLASFVILMNYFKDFDYTSAGDWVKLGLTIVSIIGIVTAVHKLTKALKTGKQQSAYLSILAFAGMLTAIGLVVTYMTEHLQANDLARAGGIAVALLAFVGVMGLMVLGLEKYSNKILSTSKGNTSAAKVKVFGTTMLSIIAMVGAVLLLAGTLYSMATGMTGWDVGKMVLISAILVATLTALSALVLAIQHFTKDKLTSITPTSSKNLNKTMAILAGFFVAFEILAGTLFGMASHMSGWDVAKMVVISATIVGTLTALTTMGLAIQYFVKKMKTDWKTIGKAGVILGGMIAAFEVLTLIFFQISKLNAEGIVGKAHAITLTLLELEVLATGMIGIGKLAKKWIEIAAGGIAMAAMIGMFELLVLIFGQIDKLKVEGIMAKSQTIVLTLLELEVLVMGVVGIGALFADSAGLLALGAAAGIAALAAMVILFDMLTDVFDKIDKLKVEGIMKKSQTIVLVLLELEVLATLSVLALPALAGALGLKFMIDLFDMLTDVFAKIDGIHVDGLLAKSQIIALTMLELETILSVCSILSVLAIAGAPGLAAMVSIFGSLSEVFLLIDNMHLDGLREKADIIVDTLLKLEGLSAIGGFIGTILGPGLLLFASGIQAVGVACNTIGNGLGDFANGVEKLVKTGPGIQAWFTNVSVGVARLATTIMTTITGLSKSVVSAIDTLITGVVTSISRGAVLIYAAAITMGNKMKDGFDSVVKPNIWGADLVKTFANGILSNLGPIINAVSTVAKIIYRYLHFSHPDEGALVNAETYMPDMMNMLGGGITSNQGLVMGPLSSLTNNMKNVLSNIDVSGIGEMIASTIGQGLFNGSGNILQWKSWLDQLLKGEASRIEQINAAVGRGATTRSQAVEKSLAKEKELEKTLQGQSNAMNEQLKYMNRYHASGNAIEREQTKWAGKIKKTTEELEAQRTETDKLAGLYVEAADAANDFGNAMADAGDKGKGASQATKEISDEIASFYDSMESAINLFEEFNKETELTSDKLLENMQSQISGMSEWADQIQKLAFMGIDQGLLQQLAEMGPQGYEYTNAFVHMTAEQLAQANNLYHQSLMLPAKVTSQIYGSYTVAGRSAASGFLMGMQKEDLKSAAVNFAHEVVDEMNLALDIQAGKAMVTYEDGVAVVNGVKTGMSAANMGKATDLLISNDIKKKFNDSLLNNDYMYSVGSQLTLGLAKGVEDDGAVNSLKGAVVRVANIVNNTFTKKEKIESPSKVFAQFGKYIVLGLADGLMDNTNTAISAMDTTADSIINTMRETLNKANEALVDGVDDPVIKPVLDLSDIQNGSRELDNMLSRNSALKASRSFSNLQNEQWNNQSALLNATMDNTDIVNAVTSLNEEVATLKDVMANIKVVLDTGTMVGAMTPAIDQSLGMRQVLAGRGI